jgi:hypothetical protein
MESLQFAEDVTTGSARRVDTSMAIIDPFDAR